MAEPSLEFLASRSSVCKSRRGTRAPRSRLCVSGSMRTRSASGGRALINEFREYVEARSAKMDVRFAAIDARFAQVHETMANNLQILLTAIGGKGPPILTDHGRVLPWPTTPSTAAMLYHASSMAQ